MLIIKLTLACLFVIPSVSYSFCFEEAGKAYGINPKLLMVIARTESNLRPHAINKNNNGTWDIGLMQINSFWVKSLKLDPAMLISDPCYNLKTGAGILRKCIDRYGYTWEAVGCYNATSMPKKMGYSWKIYEKLKAEGERLKDSKLKSPNSEFFFTVKDRETEER